MPILLRNYLDFEVDLKSNEKQSLPIFHVCPRDKMLEYLKYDRILIEEICNVFKTKILYTFYGASKYVSSQTFKNTSIGDDSVCLIMNLEQCTSIAHIYPLDTGLASGTVPGTRQYIIPWEQIKNKLDLGNDLTRVNKLILHCFNGFEEYIDGAIVVKDNEVLGRYIADSGISHIDDLHKIMKDASTGDERRYFVEVLFEEKMDLRPDRLIGVITSADLLESPLYIEQMERYRMKSTIIDNSLYYPSSFEPNLDTERKLRKISTEFTKNKLAQIK